MKRINRLWLGVGASIGVIGLVAGATLGATTLLGVTFEESEPKPVEGVQTGNVGATQPEPAQGVQADGAGIGEPKLAKAGETAGYPGFSICVQALPGDAAVEAIAKARVEGAVLELVQHQYWKFLQLDGAPPVVDIGCPSEPLVARPGVKWHEAQLAGGDWLQYVVTQPSFYRTFVYVMRLEDINRLLGGLPLRVAPQEFVYLGGDQYGQGANAIYVSSDELEDSLFMLKQLKIAVGLVGAADPTTASQ